MFASDYKKQKNKHVSLWLLLVWVVVIRVVFSRRRGCGMWLCLGWMRSLGFLWIVVGIWRVFMILILIIRGLVMRVRVGLLMMLIGSMLNFLVLVRGRRWRWILSSVCCWRSRGRRWRTRELILC